MTRTKQGLPPKKGKKVLPKAKAKMLPRVSPKKQMSQRDSYARAMYKAQKKGGSNGVGVGK